VFETYCRIHQVCRESVESRNVFPSECVCVWWWGGGVQ
jgi:hypothetical protein